MQEGNYSAMASSGKSTKEVFEDITFPLEEIMLSVDIEVKGWEIEVTRKS